MSDKETPPNPDQNAAADAALSEGIAGVIGDELEQTKAELAESKDRALRAVAELENFRKRARREAEEERRFADLPLLRELLPVVDNIGRAIEAAQKNSDAGNLLEGFKMVSQQLEGVLSRHNCKRIEAQSKPFDPHLHQAIMQQPSADFPANTVLQVVQDGFQLHDRVIRPAQVIVSTGPAA
jgi:molecular chaperone GrpE